MIFPLLFMIAASMGSASRASQRKCSFRLKERALGSNPLNAATDSTESAPDFLRDGFAVPLLHFAILLFIDAASLTGMLALAALVLLKGFPSSTPWVALPLRFKGMKALIVD